MELQTICKRIGTVATLFDDFDERPVDCDFVLPDYLPDITAVLKCTMKPLVQSRRISGDRVTVDGTVYLQLLYLDEERRCVHSYEHNQPFSSVFTVKDLKSSDVVRDAVKVGYVNCRATGPRRVDVHGAFSVCLTVLSNEGREAVTAATCEGLHTRVCPVESTVIVGQAQKTVSLNEVVDLGTMPAVALLRNEASAVITECHRVSGKAVVKGDVLLRTAYIGDAQSGEVCHVCNTVPFSQILDLEGLEEEHLCDCRVQVAQCDARLMQDPGGENRLLSVALKLTVTLECYAKELSEVVTDAYHTAFSLKTETGRFDSCRLVFARTDTVPVAITQELPDGDIAQIVDVWCEPLAVTCREENGGSVLNGEMFIGMLTADGNGVLSFYERTADYTLELPEGCPSVTAEATLLDVSYTRNGSQLEIRIQLSVQRLGLCPQSRVAITKLSVDETAPRTQSDPLDGCCLKVCFASAGESVWDLARRERTSPEALKTENGLTQDVLESDMLLLIPMR